MKIKNVIVLRHFPPKCRRTWRAQAQNIRVVVQSKIVKTETECERLLKHFLHLQTPQSVPTQKEVLKVYVARFS